MAARVYIAGPVVRRDSRLNEQRERLEIYQQIYQTLTSAGFEVTVPVSDEVADNADPQTFFRLMRDRIGAADLVITVFPDRNRSVPVESTIASFMNKRQYVIGDELDSVPRILKGLPGVVLVAPTHMLELVLKQVQRPFSSPDSNDPWGGGGEEGGGPLLAL